METNDEKVKQVFNPLYEKLLTEQDCAEIRHNLVGLFDLIIKVEKRYGNKRNTIYSNKT